MFHLSTIYQQIVFFYAHQVPAVHNRLEPFRIYRSLSPNGQEFLSLNAAGLPLFTRVDSGAVQGRCTYAAIRSLLHNYERCCPQTIPQA